MDELQDLQEQLHKKYTADLDSKLTFVQTTLSGLRTDFKKKHVGALDGLSKAFKRDIQDHNLVNLDYYDSIKNQIQTSLGSIKMQFQTALGGMDKWICRQLVNLGSSLDAKFRELSARCTCFQEN